MKSIAEAVTKLEVIKTAAMVTAEPTLYGCRFFLFFASSELTYVAKTVTIADTMAVARATLPIFALMNSAIRISDDVWKTKSADATAAIIIDTAASALTCVFSRCISWTSPHSMLSRNKKYTCRANTTDGITSGFLSPKFMPNSDSDCAVALLTSTPIYSQNNNTALQAVRLRRALRYASVSSGIWGSVVAVIHQLYPHVRVVFKPRDTSLLPGNQVIASSTRLARLHVVRLSKIDSIKSLSGIQYIRDALP